MTRKKPARPQNRVCPVCDRPYTVERSSSNQKYCSPVCARKVQLAQMEARKQRIREEMERTRAERPCAVCGQGFKSPYGKQKYCGIGCQVEGMRRAVEAQKERRKQERINHV